MQPNQLQAQATQAAQQGQQMLRSDLANKANYQNQYNTYNNQANQANQQVQQYANYMKGAGSGTNLYNQGLQQGFHDTGYDPGTAAMYSQNLLRSQNAMNALQQAAGSSLGGYGLSAAQLGNMYASQSAPLANTIQAQTNAVASVQKQYEDALTNANQYAGASLQGEKLTSDQLQNVYTNAANQRDSALSQMQFYSDLAQKQGGMNATMASSYAAALNGYQQAQAAIAQAGYLISQTKGQNIANTAAQNQLNASVAAQKAKDQKAQQAAQDKSNQMYQVMQGIGPKLPPQNVNFLSPVYRAAGDVSNLLQRGGRNLGGLLGL